MAYFRPQVSEVFSVPSMSWVLIANMRGKEYAEYFDTPQLRWRHRHLFRKSWAIAARKAFGVVGCK